MAKVKKNRKRKYVSKNRITDAEALAFHLDPTPGKFEITATVPMTTQRDLNNGGKSAASQLQCCCHLNREAATPHLTRVFA